MDWNRVIPPSEINALFKKYRKDNPGKAKSGASKAPKTVKPPKAVTKAASKKTHKVNSDAEHNRLVEEYRLRQLARHHAEGRPVARVLKEKWDTALDGPRPKEKQPRPPKTPGYRKEKSAVMEHIMDSNQGPGRPAGTYIQLPNGDLVPHVPKAFRNK